MKFKPLISVFVFLLLAVLTTAQDSIKAEFIKRINASYDQINTLKSNFEQVKTISFMTEDLVARGMFYYQKPGLMKWDQTEPDAYFFLINENEIIRFNGQKRQKLSPGSPQALIFKEFILGTVDGSIFNDARFESSFSKVNEIVEVIMTPKENKLKKRIDKIVLLFDYNSIFLNTLIIEENGGDKTVITFFDQQINIELDQTIFQ